MAFFWKKRSLRSQITVVIVGIVLFFYLLFELMNVLESTTEEQIFFNIVEDIPHDSKEYPVILWWTPFTGENGNFKKCGKEICFFTEQRKYFTDSMTRGILFYGSDFKPTDLPLPRMSYHDWGLLHEESPKNNFIFSVEKVMLLFNHTGTFKRESDLPLTLQYLTDLESLTSKEFYISTNEKNEHSKQLAPVVYVQSGCNTPSDRDSYVEELSKHIPVDSYGKCLQNKELPPPLSDPIASMDAPEFKKLIAKYKFNIAFENAICRDYVTEKLWRPLVVGSVPIYYGSPAVEDWLPNPESAILVKNYANPKQLADYLLKLTADDIAYERHLDHKLSGKISNANLISAMANRKYGINDIKKSNFVDAFECMVCERIVKNYKRELANKPLFKYQANLDHYGCPKPVSPLTLEPDSQSWWLELYNKAEFEAMALRNLMRRGTNFTSKDFYQEVINLLENNVER